MTERNWARHGLAVGRVEFRRTTRGLREDRARLLLLGIGALGMAVFFGGMAVLFAIGLRSLEGPISLPDPVRGSVALLWLTGVFVFAQRTGSQRPRIDAESLVLTTVSSRTTVAGLLVAEFLRAALYMLFPAVLLVGVVVYAFATPVSVLAVPVAVALFTASALVLGSAFGFAGVLLVARSRFVARHKTVLGTLVVLAAMGGYMAVQLPAVDNVDPTVLSWLPVSWLVDLATLGTPVAASPGRASGGLAVSLGLVVGVGAVVERLAAAYWFTEPVDVDGEGTTDPSPTRDPEESAIASALAPVSIPAVVGTPTRRVAQIVLLRLRRNPRRLWFLFMPVVVLGSTIGNVGVQSGNVLALLPIVSALFVPWIAGAAFGLNPLGDEGAVLPATLLSSIDGRQYVRGLVVPGVLFGLPLTVGATLVTGLVGPYAPTEVLALAALGTVALPVATVLAPAIGLRFPRFSAIDVGRSREVVPPSLTGLIAYSLPLGVFGGFAALAFLAPATARGTVDVLGSRLPAFVLSWLATEGVPTDGVAAWFDTLGEAITAVSLEVVQFGGFGGSLAVLLALGLWAARSAPRLVDGYTLE